MEEGGVRRAPHWEGRVFDMDTMEHIPISCRNVLTSHPGKRSSEAITSSIGESGHDSSSTLITLSKRTGMSNFEIEKALKTQGKKHGLFHAT